jgi:SGNH domain (fused to AT3 domains)
LDTIKASAGKVLFLADTPKPVTDVPDCIAQHQDDVMACNVPVSHVKYPGQLAEDAGAEAAGATVINTTPWFCTKSTCPVVIQNTIVYLDGSHITAAYALLREPELAAAIDSAVGKS